jgi:hypothetical protein
MKAISKDKSVIGYNLLFPCLRVRLGERTMIQTLPNEVFNENRNAILTFENATIQLVPQLTDVITEPMYQVVVRYYDPSQWIQTTVAIKAFK